MVDMNAKGIDLSGCKAVYTATEQRILFILKDGLPHKLAEMHSCLCDDLGPASNVKIHLSNIRKKLRPVGQDILCEIYNRTVHYRHVRLLSSVDE